MSLTATLRASITGPYQRPRGLATVAYDVNYIVTKALTDGIAAGQADLLYQSPVGGRTLAASTSEDLDLSGILTDALGDTLALVKVKAILMYAYAANVNDVVIGNGTNPFLGWFGASTNTAKIPPDGVLMHTHPGAGWTVTPGTGDILKVANGGAGTSVTYDIVIVGTSA